MSDIVLFLEGCGSGSSNRPLIEGEKKFKSNHVIRLGYFEQNKTPIIHALVLQTSNPSGKPHQIQVILNKNGETNEWLTKCSCKEGLSKKCKHIFATLFKLKEYV